MIQDHDATKDNYGVIGDHPELLDINMGTLAGGPGGGGDWMHINGISYNPTRDEIVISSHNLDEFYVIDHSTTTAEAAGHTGGTRGRGGDILYRWGCPANYDAPGMRYLNVAHCSAWIPAGLPGAGNILVFNNREGQGTSIVAEINPPYDQDGNYIWEAGSAYDPSAPAWTYTAAGFHSNHLGGCQRLANGNTIIVESTSGRIFEVDADGAIQWEYNHSREIARALRYASDYPGVYGLNPLEPGEIVLNELLAVNGSIQADQDGEYDSWIEFYNNTSDEVSLWGFTLTDENDNPDKWTFPDTSIAANDYLIVWADNDIEQEGLHLNWEPSATGSITFFAPDQTILDEISYSDQIADSSIGRYPNGMGEFMRMQPTFAAENDSSGPETSSAATQIPARFELLQNFPNPFNSTTTIRFRIAETVKVSLTVFNITGAQVGVLTQATLTPGEYSVNWNGSDSSGKALAAGLYFYTLHAGAFSATRKLIYLK
ncbi:T9SS C-terminal target domain-containing protein [bacterium]|nr:MAG: T9SS C-terminal target domain-containing protein [bacterium]